MTPEPKGKLDTMATQTTGGAQATMAVVAVVNGPEDELLDWHAVGWRAVEEDVRRLRQRIFTASRVGDLKRVRSLQKLMLRSRANTLLSVRRVTELNAGRATAGVDGKVVLLAEAKALLVDRVQRHTGPWQARPVKRVYIPKKGSAGKRRPLGIPVILDRVLQARVVNALEPEWEARFEPRSYGFRPGRGCHDAIGAIFNVARGANPRRRWVLDADLAAAFDRIDHDHLLGMLGTFPARGLIADWLKAGVVEEGRFTPTQEGTPQGGVVTPPTQLAIRVYFALRVVLRVLLGPVAGVAADGDGVANGDLVGADEDVFDEQPQDPLALGHASGGSLVAQPGQEVLEVVGELEVDLTVGELGVQGVELVAQAGLAGPQLGHAGAQLVQGDQLLLVGADEPLDRLAGLGQGGVEPFALRGGRVGGAVLGEPLGDLGSDQGGVGQQPGDVVPDEAVEVVGADRLVGADSAVLVAVVVRAQAAVVVDLLVRGPGGGAVVGVPAAAAGADALQQRGIGAVTRREALVVLQPSLDPGPGVFGDQGRDGDLQPLLAVAVDDGVVPWRGAPGQACGAVESGGLLGAHRLGEAGPLGVGGVTQHAPERGAVPAGLAGAGGHAQAAEPAGQLGDRDPAVGVAGEQVRDDRRLVRHGLVAGFGVLALADVAVAERGAGQHVDGAGLGAVGLAAAGAFQDLGAFILGDHALELHQQRVLGAVTAWPFDEHHLGAGLGELLDQQRLVGILAGQPVRGVHQQHVHRHLADQAAPPLQRRAHP